MKEVIKTDSIYCTSIINCKRYSHYSQLFNCVACDRHKNYTLDAVNSADH